MGRLTVRSVSRELFYVVMVMVGGPRGYRIAGYFRGVYISQTANSILVREKYFHEWRY